MKAIITFCVIVIVYSTSCQAQEQTLCVSNTGKSAAIKKLLETFEVEFPATRCNTNCQQASIELHVGEQRQIAGKLSLILFQGKEKSAGLYCVVNDAKASGVDNFLSWVYGKGRNTLKEQLFFPVDDEQREKEQLKFSSASGSVPSCEGLDELNARRKSKKLKP